MVIDNLKINEKAIENMAFSGTISSNNEIVKLQKSAQDIRHKYLVDLLIKCSSTAYTHCGTMHADEVFATAEILLARNTIINNKTGSGSTEFISTKQIKNFIKRVKSIDEVKDPMDKCIVLDLLDGHYDHHHKNQDNRKDYPDSILLNKAGWTKPVKMATFGALWSDIGDIFNIEGVKAPNLNVKEIFLMRFILPMDQQDNYGPYYCPSPISKVISNFNAYSEFENFENLSKKSINKKEKSIPLDFKFVEAVKMAYTILRNEIMSVQRLVQAIIDIKESDKISFRNFGFITGGNIGAFHAYPLTGIEIAKVPEGKRAPSIQMDAVNETVYEKDGNKFHPLFLINKNPDQRDGMIRMVLGRYVKIDPAQAMEWCGDLIYYINPNDGYLISFETEEKLERFLNSYFPALIKFQ